MLPGNHHNFAHKDFAPLREILKGSETPTAVLRALLPSSPFISQAEGQLTSNTNNYCSDSTSFKLFTFLIFAMANNFAGLNSVPIEEIIVFLNRYASTRLLQQFLRTSGPESEAFAEKLFQAAILMEEAHIVKILLQKGLVPHDLVCVHRGRKYTPLEYSSMVWNIEITKFLLDAKLDVNKSIEKEGSGGAIVRAFGGRWWQDEHPRGVIPSELVHMLLEAGGIFAWSQLEPSTLRTLESNQEILDTLLDNAFKTKTYDQAWHQFARDFTKKCDNATATTIVTTFLKAWVDIDHSPSPTLHYQLTLALESAAQRGNLELVQTLLRSHVCYTRRTLICAIKSRNKELIRFLLDNRADADACDESATEYRYESVAQPAPSPLSEAIRWGDAEILGLLERKGAWSRIVNKVTVRGEFEDVLIAASVRGKFTTVQKLLKYRPSNTYGNDLSDALVAAIYLNKSAIVLTLLDAGANVNGGLYEVSDIDTAVTQGFDSASGLDAGMDRGFRENRRGPALLEALLQKNEHLVRLILDADVRLDEVDHRKSELQPMTALRAAVEWGNIPIIKDLISMGIPMASEAVEVSIKKRDIECTQLLVRAGVDTSWALISAVTNNNIEMVEYLFSVGAHPDNSRALLEAEALSDGLPMIVRLLTEFARSYPHGKPGYGGDAFQQAIRKGNLALIKLLLDAKIIFKFEKELPELYASPYRLSQPSSLTLLGKAIQQRHTTSLAILQMLLNEVKNPNIVVQTSAVHPYYVRETALLAAIDTKEIQKVQLFIDARANVNWPATKGVKRTPLQKAAEIGSFEITQLLIERDGLVNNEPAVRGGATALQLAAIGGYRHRGTTFGKRCRCQCACCQILRKNRPGRGGRAWPNRYAEVALQRWCHVPGN